MEEEIRAVLLASSGITALAGTRVDFGSNPQGSAFPRVVLWTIDNGDGLNIDGPDGFFEGRVQVDCYGTTYSAAKSLSRAVITSLNGYAGGGLQLVRLISTRDTRESGTNEADRPFRVSLDFATFYNPAG